MSFNFGKTTLVNGEYKASKGVVNDNYDSALGSVAGRMSNAIDNLGGQVDLLMTQMAETPADTGLLAQFQAKMGAYTQTVGVAAGAVATMKKAGDDIINKT